MPDLAEANNTSDDGALNAFEPIEPDAHVFVTHPEAGQQIVSGGRGMGKSTLLIYRMRRLRNMRKSFKLVRTTARLGWRLKTNGIAVPTGSLAYLSQPSNWTAIWLTILELLFAYAIAREDIGTRADKLDECKALFGASKDDDLFLEVLTALCQMGSNPHEERLHELIQPLIRANVPPHTLATWRARYVQPVLDRRRGKDASEPTRWFLYVDCIDETLCHEDSDPARTRRGIMNRGTAERFTVPTGDLGARGISRENARSLVYELWIAAQVGYALAAHDLRQRTGALIALGSFRSETLDRFKLEVDLLDGKLKGFLHELDHDEDLLRKIFQYNAIDLMDDKTSSERAVGTDRHTKACVRLCGHERIFNRSVFGVEEDVFSLIRRHNFGTPRGLMLLGGAVRDVPLLAGPGGRTRDPSAVVEAVNKAAVQVFLEYRNTLFPSWDGDYELGESLIDSNVITRSDAVKLEAAFKTRLDEGQGTSPITINATISGLRFFFDVTVDRRELMAKMQTVQVPQRLPVVLSRDEVARLIAAAPNLKSQTALSVAYATGLRVSEVVSLKVTDIDSQRMTLRVEQGKGRKDRYAMLPPVLLERLRGWWRLAHAQGKMLPGGWLFPGLDPVEPLTARQLNRAIHIAAERAKIDKRVTMHTLRHSFATHLLEQKVDIRVIQVMLGHKKLETTVVYTHVATEILREVVSPLESVQPA